MLLQHERATGGQCSSCGTGVETWRGSPAEAHHVEDMSTVDPPAARESRALTHGPWQPVRTGCRAAGTPLQHPSIHPWRPASSPAARRSTQWDSLVRHGSPTVGASEFSNSLRSIGQIGDEWPCYNNVHAWDITCDSTRLLQLSRACVTREGGKHHQADVHVRHTAQARLSRKRV